MPMGMNNGAMAAAQQMQQQQQPQQASDPRRALNTYIYDYFLKQGMYDLARSMLNSDPAINVVKDSPRRRDENGNVLGNGAGDDPMDTDNKDELDSKRPSDLPAANVPPTATDSSFLSEWFSVFWDVLHGQKSKTGSAQVMGYINHTQVV